MKLSSFSKLTIAVVVSELAGIIGSVFTSSAIPTWYATLTKPYLTPPGWVFAPVWVILYALMGIAAFLIWKKGLDRTDVRKALCVFGLQLVLNTAWPIVFFGLHSPEWALVIIALMWLAIVWTMMLFRNISKPAMWILVPYILWVSFASYLNYSIWMLNYSMYEMKETLAITGAILACIGNISYLRDVLQERIQPHPYTWFIWSIVSMTTFFGGLAKGAGIGALPTGVAEFFTIVIFVFSLKYVFQGKVGHIRVIDHYFLAICLLGLIPWMLTKDPTISVVIVVLIDIIAFMPTLRKTWMNPQTEKPMLYEMNVARHILTLFSLQTYNIATMFHSIAMICINTVMTIFIKRSKK